MTDRMWIIITLSVAATAVVTVLGALAWRWGLLQRIREFFQGVSVSTEKRVRDAYWRGVTAAYATVSEYLAHATQSNAPPQDIILGVTTAMNTALNAAEHAHTQHHPIPGATPPGGYTGPPQQQPPGASLDSAMSMPEVIDGDSEPDYTPSAHGSPSMTPIIDED